MVSQKEQKHHLPDLNSLPAELEEMHASTSVAVLPNKFGTRVGEQGVSQPSPSFRSHGFHPLSSTSLNIGVDSIGKNMDPTTNQTCKKLENLVASIENARPCGTGFPATNQTWKELYNTVRSVENERSGVGGYLEAEEHCDNLIKESGFPATNQTCKELDNTVRSVENERSGVGGYLEAEEHCDNLTKESSQCNVEEGVDFYAAHVLVLDNLEKDISPSDVIKFITDMTTSIVQVYIFPCPKSQTFTKGFVWFKDQASLQKVYAFLKDDNFLIVSARGRPWVAVINEYEENRISKGILGAMTANSHSQKPNPSSGTLTAKKILFVHKGTSEYEQAKQMKDRFLEFSESIGHLHKRFENEERALNEQL